MAYDCAQQLGVLLKIASVHHEPLTSHINSIQEQKVVKATNLQLLAGDIANFVMRHGAVMIRDVRSSNWAVGCRLQNFISSMSYV